MLGLRDWPNIVSVLLLSWSKRSMRLVVHCRHLRSFLLLSASWIEYIFGTLATQSRNSIRKSLFLNHSRKLVTSDVGLAKRFSLMALILHFLKIIVVVSETCKVLRLYYFAYLF